jgi:hypothetical protein
MSKAYTSSAKNCRLPVLRTASCGRERASSMLAA